MGSARAHVPVPGQLLSATIAAGRSPTPRLPAGLACGSVGAPVN
jgi:hypothetical protein